LSSPSYKVLFHQHSLDMLGDIGDCFALTYPAPTLFYSLRYQRPTHTSLLPPRHSLLAISSSTPLSPETSPPTPPLPNHLHHHLRPPPITPPQSQLNHNALTNPPELSLTVPVVNSLAFLFTVLGEWCAEGKIITRDTWIGMTLVCAGIGLCVWSKI